MSSHYTFYVNKLTDEYIMNLPDAIWNDSLASKAFNSREQFIRVMPSCEGRYAVLRKALPQVLHN